jgi:DNA-binding MarR family transcriptional regulator
MSDATDFFDAVVRYEIDLWNAVDAALQVTHGLALGRFQALRVLHDRCCDGRVQDVAGDLRITIGAASKLVDRLEHDGTARRQPNPNDRRSSLIALTAEGRRVHDAASATFESALRASLPTDLTDGGLAGLTARLEQLRGHLEVAAGAEVTA